MTEEEDDEEFGSDENDEDDDDDDDDDEVTKPPPKTKPKVAVVPVTATKEAVAALPSKSSAPVSQPGLIIRIYTLRDAIC
jgi:hypothetical protein